ncbi:cellulase/esterase CelE [Abditibacteriota bacterium]|nr:cellulase/esterase CelE [Abditibacteriota bacterium]
MLRRLRMTTLLFPGMQATDQHCNPLTRTAAIKQRGSCVSPTVINSSVTVSYHCPDRSVSPRPEKRDTHPPEKSFPTVLRFPRKNWAVVLAGCVLTLVTARVLLHHPKRSVHAATDPTTRVGDPLHPETLPEDLQKAYADGARHMTIRPGIYLIPRRDKTLFSLDGWKDTIIRANGVTIISSETKSSSRFWALNDCKGVVLDGATLTQTAMSSYQGKVVALTEGDGDKHFVQWRPDAGYPIPQDGDSKIDCFFADPATQRLKLGVGDFWGRPQKSLGDGTFQVELDGRIRQLKVGDKLVGRYGDMPFKVLLWRSRNCIISNVTMMRNGFSPIREDGFGGGANRILNCRWTTGPRPEGATEKVLVSGAADGLHSTFANPGPDIENCTFDGIILDDPFAIHGTFNEVVASNGREVTVKDGSQFGPDAPPTPTVRFYDQKGFVAVGTVMAFKNNGDNTATLTLDKDLGVPVGAKGTNPALCGAGFKILNCQIRGTRSRGILVKGDNGLIAGNLIEDCGMSAISAGPEYYWNEADYVRGLRIENNTFRRNGDIGGPTIFVHGEGAQGNRDITIQNNRFDSNFADDIEAKWAQNLTISGNTFTPMASRPTDSKPTSPMVIGNDKTVSIRANIIASPSKYAPELLRVGDDVAELQRDTPLQLPTDVHDGSLRDSNLKFIGRWDKSDAAAFHSYWGGAYIRAKFKGTSVKANTDSVAGGPDLLVSLDGEPPHEVKEINLTGLKNIVHTLVIGAPNQNSEVVFRGLTLDAGATTLPAETRPLVEFIGDSITTGGGKTLPSTVNYAWLSAEKLGADHTQIAFSGRALTSGFGCSADTTGLDAAYFYLKNFNHLDEQPPVFWDFSTYTPQIVVINLGQNDQCGNEPSVVVQSSYTDFMDRIRARLPRAHIVALRPFGGPYANFIRLAVEARRAEGDTRVQFVDTTGWLENKDLVDGIHPTEAGHAKAAALLSPILQPLLNSPR